MPRRSPGVTPTVAATLTARALFSRACDPECLFPADTAVPQLRGELRRLRVAATGPDALRELGDQTRQWATDETRRYQATFDAAPDAATRTALVRRAVLGCAPLALVGGAWLQWLSAPGNAEDPIVLRVLARYADDLGAGHPRAARGSAYLALLRHLHLAENAVPTARITVDQRVAERAFHLPAVLLAMSRRPADFGPEIHGADLCLRTVRLLPALTPVRQAHPAATDWTALDLGAARQADRRPAVEEAWLTASHLDTERLVDGFGWALAALQRWSGELHAEVDAARNPAFDMAELLRLRAREGAVYHHDFPLLGRSLSDWLTECRTDPLPLLAALADSRLVRPGRPEASPLVNGLVGERGPMFRVFSPADLQVIRRWIAALPTAAPPPGRAVAAGTTAPLVTESVADPGRRPTDPREAYHLLLNREDTPALRQFALEYVRGWLARSAHQLDRAEHLPPTRWTPAGLRPWLQEQHDQHGREFAETARTALPSREDLVHSTVQLAPLTLIDGAWLQGFTDYELAASDVGHGLFATYWDELGNGEPRLNHPRIYRQVLAQMGVEPPATASVEFARWPGFEDASFELPVYWLCIGRLPRTFQPEVLGLNLAMELSGVGGGYRRARLALKRHGFSTRFVDIHNTIDNVATGHSAWAADACDAYLAGIAATGSTAAVDAAWERIRVGYRSLSPPTDRWARRAGRKASWKELAGV